MNHIYRLVWNRARGVMQVASEVSGSGSSGGSGGARQVRRPRAGRLACALLLAAGSGVAMFPAAAASLLLEFDINVGTSLIIAPPAEVVANVTITSFGNNYIDFADTLDGPRALAVNAGGLIVFHGAVGGTTPLAGLTVNGGTFEALSIAVDGPLSVTTTAGDIGQGGAFTVAGVSTFNAGTNAITLTNAGNDFAGAVNLAGGTTAIADANALTLGTLDTGALTAVSQGALNLGSGTISGDLVATTGGGAITQAGALQVSGTSRFDAGSADIVLTNVGNDFGGAVRLAGNDASIADSNELALGWTTLAGDLQASAGSLSQSAAVQVGGTTSLSSSSGDIVLDNAGNDFQGSVAIDSAGSVSLVDGNDLVVSSLQVGADSNVSLSAAGTLTMAGVALDAGMGNLSLSSGGALAVSGALSGVNVGLSAGNGLTLGSDVTAIGGSTLSGGAGSIVQTGGSLTTAVLGGGGATLGSVTLEGAGNSIGVLGDFAAASFSLVNSVAMRIDGNSTIAGDMRLVGPSFTLLGSIDAGSTTLGPNTTMDIGNGGTAGTLAGDLNLEAGSGVTFRRSGNVTYAGSIAGIGTLHQQGPGKLVLDGDSSAFAGSTLVAGGTLVVGSRARNGAVLGGDVSVARNATLGGHGTIAGNVDIAAGGRLAPGNSIGTLSIDGDLAVGNGAVLDYEFGVPGSSSRPGSSDRVDVGGDVSLDGAVLDVTDAGGMGPGLYTLMTWGGALAQSNGGLALGSVPAGQELQLQVLANRINLLSLAGLTLNFWNANGAATPTQAGGGSGTWSTTSANWTDADATVTGAMAPQPGFAVFGGDAGTVVVDGGRSAVTASGMQFASDGYRIEGDTLTLVGDGDMPVIRVGDGSAAGAAMTATIASVIDGVDGLRKDDAGTLVLAGANTYSGGTVVVGGTLALSGAGVAPGAMDVAGGATFDVSQASADVALAALTGAGDLRLGGHALSVAGGAFSGTVADGGLGGGSGGSLRIAAGTLALSGANTYTGATTVDAGATLALAGTGSIAASSLLRLDGSFDIAGTSAGASVADLAGAGAIALGDQVLALTAASGAFTGTLSGDGGALRVDGGTLATSARGASVQVGPGTTLQVGTGGTSGAIAGDVSVAAGGALVFDRSDTVDFAGLLQGGGVLRQQGTGTLVVSADNSAFAGHTDVAQGTLIVGAGAGSAAVLGGDVAVAAGATLGGHGRIEGDVTNAGTLAPGASLGTLGIGGDYRQTATGTLQIEATAGGTSDKLVVEGAATLDGSMVALAQDGDWQARTSYTILTAAGGVSGRFAGATSSLLFLDPLLAYGTNDVTLTLRRNDIAFESVAQTRNQAGVAAAADALGWGNAVYEELTTLDARGAAAAFDSLSGEIHASTRGALLGDARQLRDALVQQLAPVEAGDRGSAWLTGWGHWSHVDADGNAAAVDGDGSGFAIGGDVPVGGRVRLGALAGSGRLSVDSDGRSAEADVSSRHAGAYALVDAGILRFQAGTVRSTHGIDSRRSAVVGDHAESLRGDSDADTTQSYLDASHRFAFGPNLLAPFANVARVRVHGDAFDETGGDAALHVDAGTNERTVSTFGARWDWTSQSKTVRFWGTAAWTRVTGDDGGSATARFADGATRFGVAGPALAGEAVALDMGLRWQASRRATIEATWNGRFGDGERDHGARVSVRMGF